MAYCMFYLTSEFMYYSPLDINFNFCFPFNFPKISNMLQAICSSVGDGGGGGGGDELADLTSKKIHLRIAHVPVEFLKKSL